MKSKLKIISNTCVNSKWVASWLAKKDEEYCQCLVGCKIAISYHDYQYIVTQSEYNELKKEANGK